MRLMVSGGGTGGHVYPALAVINQLDKIESNNHVMYVGSKRGIESSIVPKLNLPFEALDIQGFKRSLSFENFKTLYLFFKSVLNARKLIKRFHPDVVLGTGGYVSGAVLYAAAKMGVPTVIHEQNSVVGITNKFLSHYVDKIAINFEDARHQFPTKKVVLTGNPRAQEAFNTASNFSLSKFGLKNDVPTVMIVGGSQGAFKINQVVVDALATFAQRDYQVIFVTGPKRFNAVISEIQKLGTIDNVAIRPYVENMPAVFRKLAVIVCRAGATTLAEITAIGVPAILIPSPYVTADHQTKNAQSLVDQGAAVMIKEIDLTVSTLISAIDNLVLNSTHRAKMAEASNKIGKTNAADEMIAVLKSVTHEV